MNARMMLRCGAAALSLTAASANAATINLIDLGGVTGSPAEQGFRVAANYWATMFTNNAVINLGVGFSPLAPNVIAQAGSRRADMSVATWQNLLNATKSNSAIDQALVLPGLTGGGISGLTVGVGADGVNNDPTVTAFLDGSQTASKVLYANSSVIKALGGNLANPGQNDANITFSSTFGFDFNPGDGITPNTFDFIGVAIHEIGHALGFVSGVDFFDVFSGNGPGAGQLGYDLNDTSIFSALDMFRYSAPGTLDMRPAAASYFSIDGGQTALFGNRFATGRYNGDGDQASHWRDAVGCQTGLGIMDPTFCFEQDGFVTGLDLAAFDAMGWNLRADALNYGAVSTTSILRGYVGAAIPEPATWAMMIIGFGMVGGAYRRRNTSVAYKTA